MLYSGQVERTFEAHLNQEQLNKVLMDLMGYYKTATTLGITTPNSAEFKCYFIIMMFGGVENKQKKKFPNRCVSLSVCLFACLIV
jgi:hypothetical protein